MNISNVVVAAVALNLHEVSGQIVGVNCFCNTENTVVHGNKVTISVLI